MSATRLRDALVQDYSDILRLNKAEVEWTSPLTKPLLAALAAHAGYFKVAESGTEVAGFMLAMRDNSDYDNANLAWFKARYSSFLYIDRIVIDAGFAGRGIGRLIYNDARAFAGQAGLRHLVCEYCIKPMNSASQAFHDSMGFAEVGQRDIDGSDKVVSMQLLTIKKKTDD